MANNRPKLTRELQARVVADLASWAEAVEVRRWLREEFEIEIGLPALLRYDMDNAASRAEMQTARPDLVQLFDETREAARKSFAGIAIATQGGRLRILQRRLRAVLSKERVNDDLVLRMLELAAKDSGGAFTNLRKYDFDPRGALAELVGADVSQLPGGGGADA